MSEKILEDEKGYIAQINCNKIFPSGAHILAGEDSLVSINGEIQEKIKNRDGYLVHIEDACELSNGHIIVISVEGDIGVYKNLENNKYKLIKNFLAVLDDCLYYIEAQEGNKVKIWGEIGIEYIIEI